MKRLTSQSRTTTTIRTPQAGPSGQLRRCCATESLLIGLVLRRLFVKSGKEQFRRCGRVDRTIDDHVFGADSLPVQPTITVDIRAKRRAFQRDPGKQSARTRIRKNLSPKCDVGAELDLASKNGIGSLLSKGMLSCDQTTG